MEKNHIDPEDGEKIKRAFGQIDDMLAGVLKDLSIEEIEKDGSFVKFSH